MILIHKKTVSCAPWCSSGIFNVRGFQKDFKGYNFNMASLIYDFIKFIDLCFGGLSLLMLVRAIVSWFPGVGTHSKVMNFVVGVTEMFISPVRQFMNRFDAVRTFPLDLSFLVTYILIGVVRTIIVGIGYSLMAMF